MNEKEELEHLRKLAQENSERNHRQDSINAESMLIGFTWTMVFILTIVVFRMTSWDENAWWNIIIPTVASVGMARWYRAGVRIQRETEKEKLDQPGLNWEEK